MMADACVVFRRMLRYYLHLYYHCFDAICKAGDEVCYVDNDSYYLQTRLNDSFRHLYVFITTFDLVPEVEMAPCSMVTDCMGLTISATTPGSVAETSAAVDDQKKQGKKKKCTIL